MKTVQQCFNICDVNELLNVYNHRYPIEIYYDSDDQELHPIRNRNKKLLKLIKIIQAVELKPSEENWILFAHYIPDNDFLDIDVSLVKQSELHDEIVQTYAYELSPVCETAGFYVADLPVTQESIYTVLSTYLFESSIFGYEQEYLDDMIDKLYKDSEIVSDLLKESTNISDDNSKYKSTLFNEYLNSSVYEECNSKNFKEYQTAYWDYCRYSFNSEIQKLIQIL